MKYLVLCDFTLNSVKYVHGDVINVLGEMANNSAITFLASKGSIIPFTDTKKHSKKPVARVNDKAEKPVVKCDAVLDKSKLDAAISQLKQLDNSNTVAESVADTPVTEKPKKSVKANKE